MGKTKPLRGIRSFAGKGGLLASTAILIGITGQAALAQGAGQYFERVATVPVFINLPNGADPTTETVAEIIAATADGMTLAYTDSPGDAIGIFDISDPTDPIPSGRVELGGEPTSVAISGSTVYAAVNTSESYTAPSGFVGAISLSDRTMGAQCDVQGQPDSIAVSPDGSYLAVVVENERDEDLNDGEIPQAPPGHLAVFALGDDGAITNCDAATIVDMTGLADVAPSDPEPEYVDINSDNIAVVTLQENNYLVLVDLASGSVTGHFSAGTVDLDAIDATEEGIIRGTDSLSDVPREPDAVTWLDTDRFATANEGDYLGGSRGFTIFSTDGTVLFDSGEGLEYLGMSYGHYPEDRAENKGVEPEGIDFGQYGDDALIFVASERGNFVAVYQDNGADTAPDLLQFLPTAVGPEGLLTLPDRDMFIVATEVDEEDNGLRATLAFYTRTADMDGYPTLVSDIDPATGAPIGWGALSGLVAAADDVNTLYAVSDSFYATSRIYTIDLSSTPARITDFVELTRDGEPVGYDLEGIALRDDGGFWLASEGHPGNERSNYILGVNTDGMVEQEITLPDDLVAQAVRFGFEGVASWADEGGERLIVAIQREWADDPDNQVKLGIYDPSSEAWSFVGYPIAEPMSERGGWVGLSEITYLGDQRFALIERDNQPGIYSAHKVVTVISLDGVDPVPYGETLPVVEPTVAIDLLPLLQASNGWISDKPEGLAVTSDGAVYLVTDNDGVDDATGETLLLNIGSADQLQAGN